MQEFVLESCCSTANLDKLEVLSADLLDLAQVKHATDKVQENIEAWQGLAERCLDRLGNLSEVAQETADELENALREVADLGHVSELESEVVCHTRAKDCRQCMIQERLVERLDRVSLLEAHVVEWVRALHHLGHEPQVGLSGLVAEALPLILQHCRAKVVD